MLPLSYAQQRLWFFNMLEGPSSAYNVPLVITLRGALDVPALERALGDLTARHESLRTLFVESDGEPHQHILPVEQARLAVPVVECAAGAVESTVRELARRPFDLGADAPVRVWLLRVSADQHRLLVVMHHAVCDGWSMTPLLRDLERAYNARAAGGQAGWDPLPVQYSDYMLWQRELLGSDNDEDSVGSRQLRYWRDELTGLPEELALPFDRVRPAVASQRGQEINFRVRPEVHAALQDIARQTRSTLFMVLQAAVAAVLARLGAGTDIPLGTAIAGRTDPAMDDLVGSFVNTLVVRADVSGDPTFRQLVERVRQRSLVAYEHQDLPFERVVEGVNPVRSRARHPLFQVGVELHVGDLALTLTGLDTHVELLTTSVARFDLSVVVRERVAATGAPQGLSGTVEYAVDLFDADTAATLVERLVTVLTALAAEPDIALSAVDVLTPDERDRLRAWQDTDRELPDKTVMAIFEERAALTPDATALVAGDTTLSFVALNAEVNRLAHHLIEIGVAADAPVAVALPRTAASVVAWLAVGKAGGVYTPIDPQYPAERIRQILTDAVPAALVTTEAVAAGLGDPASLPQLVTDIRQQDRPVHNPTDADRPRPLSLDNAAYIIYTSGSTGQPKGVTVLHRALTNLWTFHADVTFPPPAPPTGQRRIALSASLSFDTSWEGVLAMIAGHELHLLDELTRRDPARMVDYVVRHRIAQVDVTPSFAQQLLAEGLLSGDSALETLMLGGEAVSEPLWSELHATPTVTAFNYYGPSEFCVEATGCALSDHGTATIGRPVYNTQVHVLDDRLNPVPPGVYGEIYLAGANLGRGYLGRPGMTAERFVANPFGGPGERMYRSGDVGRWTSDGYLLFAGRSDDQVKIRGFRIEPGEIEAMVAAHPSVADVVVLVREDTPGDTRLVAYVVPVRGHDVDDSEVRARLAAQLPDFMVPAAFVQLAAVPLNRNGKLDRRALPVPDYGAHADGRAPVTEREKAVAGLFAEILKVDAVSLDANFFELGGHSLLATRLVNRIRSVLGAEVNLLRLFENPTVAGVVASVGEETSTAASRPKLVRRP